MRITTRSVKPKTNLMQSVGTGPVIAKIKGSIKKTGIQYRDAVVVLYNKYDFKPIAAYMPDANGNYSFLALNTDLTTFIVVFDKNQEFNAVIQDNVVPK